MTDTDTFGQLLAERERRWNARQGMAKASGCSVLSLTLNIPGPDKNLPGVEAAFAELRAALRRAVLAAGGKKAFADEQNFSGPDGPCWLAAVRMDALALKVVTVGVEDCHPLGRLADADVMDSQSHPVNRDDIGHASRRCFLCSRPAAQCRRERRHDQQDVLDVARFLLRRAEKGENCPAGAESAGSEPAGKMRPCLP